MRNTANKDWNYVRDVGHRKGLSDTEIDIIIEQSHLPNRKHLHSHGPLAYQDYVYALVRIFQPESVVETGVRYGVLTTHVLQAMADNRKGHLVSCDPMHSDMIAAMAAMRDLCRTPQRLFGRWRFHGAKSSEVYPGAKRTYFEQMMLTAGTEHMVDMFIHDSDHAYDPMTWELETALPSVRPGGLIVCDDWDWVEHSEAHRHKGGNVVEKFAACHSLSFHTIGTAAVFEV